MAGTLVIGLPGSGKSTLVKELVARGENAYDADDVPGLGGWYDMNDRPAAMQPSADWMATHHYLWDTAVLQGLVEINSGRLIVAGMAHNFFEAIPLFGQVAFLDVGARALRSRLASPERSNAVGSTPAQAESICQLVPAFAEAVGAISLRAVNAERPINEVADEILALTLADQGRLPEPNPPSP
jgi:hypothetical protein